MTRPSIKPNFFIIGAPKSGTTSLANYLSAHPEVHFSDPKEPKYFHSDFHPEHRYALDEGGYLGCFDPGEMSRCSAVGEGTVWYLYSEVAVSRILEFNPEARLIAMLRNPVDLAYSLHSQLLYGGHENLESFEEAWRAQEDRAQGRSVPFSAPDAKALLYGQVALLGRQLEHLFSQVPREQVLTIVYDDFAREPAEVYARTLSFLGLEPTGGESFERHNANREIRFRHLAGAFHIAAALKRKLGLRRSLGIWKRASPKLSRHRPRPGLSPAFRAELQDYFREDVRLLSELLGRDLSSWCS